MASSSTVASPPDGSLAMFYETWHIRVLMIVSLTIQILLTITAPKRKRSTSGIFGFYLWLLYLSADSIALSTIAVIARSDLSKPQELIPFWAPFLLMHLGGPDTITALALEDNELWLRHALQLVTQLGVTLYVIVHSFHENHLWFPMMLILVNGCIKYYERICALYFASTDVFRESVVTEAEPGSNYVRLMEECSTAKAAHIPATFIKERDTGDATRNEIRINIEDSDHASQFKETNETVKQAYVLYDKFKVLIADGFLSFKDRKETRDSFLKKQRQEAFRIVEIELNIMYDVFYTKAILSRRKHLFLRIVSFFLVLLCLVLFFADMSKYHNIKDVCITIVLVGFALALDIGGIILLVLSDWCIFVSHVHKWNWARSLFLTLSKPDLRASCQSCSRWSETISQYSVLKRYFKDPPCFYKLLFVKRLKDALIGWLYVESKDLDDKMIQFIYDELWMKAKLVPDDPAAITQACSARGNLLLEKEYMLVSSYLSPWTLDVDYDESLLTWHLATDMCYFSSNLEHQLEYRELSKNLSNYMSYLLLTKPGMLSPVIGMADIRFEDTRAEANKFLKNSKLDSWWQNFCCKVIGLCWCKKCQLSTPLSVLYHNEEEFIKQFCCNVLGVEAYEKPIVAKGDKSKSVLFDACRLAKQLEKLGDEQWKITSKVWLEMLCYAANRCPARSHVQQLSKGGELITVVWILMTHLGLGDRFLQNRGFGWTKLIIHK